MQLSCRFGHEDSPLGKYIMTVRRTKRKDKRFKAGVAWNDAEVAWLIKLYPKTRNRCLAVTFGRSVWGIIGKARGLGLEKDYAGGYKRQQCLEPVAWSTEEEELLCRLFPSTPNEEIAELLGRSLDTIRMKSRKLVRRNLEI